MTCHGSAPAAPQAHTQMQGELVEPDTAGVMRMKRPFRERWRGLGDGKHRRDAVVRLDLDDGQQALMFRRRLGSRRAGHVREALQHTRSTEL